MRLIRSRFVAAAVGATLLVGAAVPLAPSAYADISELEQQRDEANARADEAAANRDAAAARAEQAEQAQESANASAAATQSELEQANARLDELFMELEIAKSELGEAVYDLEQTRAAIEDLEGQIAQTEQELAREQQNLSSQVSTAYKGGPARMLEMVLDATTFDDFVSRVLYANKVTEQFTATIDNVRAIHAQLSEQRAQLAAKEAEQEQLVALKEERQAAAELAEAAQEDYVGSLSAELVAAIESAREAEAEAALARAQEAEFAAAEDEARGEAAERQRQADEEREEQARKAAAGYVAPYVGSAATGDQRSIAVNAALSQVGLPYIWGEELPGVGFDCNSLTHWAWAQAGVGIPYPSGTYAYGQFQWLKSSGRWVFSQSELQPGDLVFYSYNGGANCYHVALYLGGGQVVHAHSYRMGVTVTSIDACAGFCGGGSPI